jgi:hypothetical protein
MKKDKNKVWWKDIITSALKGTLSKTHPEIKEINAHVIINKKGKRIIIHDPS